MTHTQEELLKLIAKMNGWSDSATIQLRYQQERLQNRDGDTIGMSNEWRYYVSTSQCTTEKIEYTGQGKTLEEALLDLANSIVPKLLTRASWNREKAQKADEALREFQKLNSPPTTSPYRD
jgi:hypothetical protein